MTSIFDKFIKKKTDSENNSTLRVDCRQCGNEPDLGAIGCVRCLCGLIDIRDQPESIVLRSGSEITIDGDTVSILNRLASEYDSIHAGKAGKKCEWCILSASSLENEKWCDLSLENISEVKEKLDSIYVNCPRGKECIREAKEAFVQMNENLERISKDAAKTAFRVIGI